MKPRYKEWDLECKVYVGNLGTSATRHELEAAFSKYGPLRNVWVARNPPGFAFVLFEDRRDAEDSCRGLDGTRICGSRIRAEMSSGNARRERDRAPERGRRERSERYRSRSPRPSYSRSRSPTPVRHRERDYRERETYREREYDDRRERDRSYSRERRY